MLNERTRTHARTHSHTHRLTENYVKLYCYNPKSIDMIISLDMRMHWIKPFGKMASKWQFFFTQNVHFHQS